MKVRMNKIDKEWDKRWSERKKIEWMKEEEKDKINEWMNKCKQ